MTPTLCALIMLSLSGGHVHRPGSVTFNPDGSWTVSSWETVAEMAAMPTTIEEAGWRLEFPPPEVERWDMLPIIARALLNAHKHGWVHEEAKQECGR